MTDRDLAAPYVQLFYDIETLGLDPLVSTCIQASLVFVRSGVRDRHLVAVGSVAPIPNVTVHACENEAALLRRIRRLVVQHDPDFVVAYNGVNFDNRYLAVRAERALDGKPVPEFWMLSRYAARPTRLRELRLQSGGMGDNLLRYFDMPGRVTLDWFIKLKRDLTSEPVYTLNHFARKFCGAQKDDMDYRDIPKLQAGSAEDRARLGKYCVVDSELLADLDDARAMTVEILQFSAVFGVLPEWIYFRGQQVRFVAVLLDKARTAEAVPLLLNRPDGGFFGEGNASFDGATVNEPKRGFYRTPVLVADWMSLYPSIMVAHNLCHSTHVLDPAHFAHPGVVEHRVGDGFVTRFVSAATHKGILPRILEELHAERKAAKRRVKECLVAAADVAQPDEARARSLALSKVFDGRQLALKVSMNSVYGATGATDTGKYPDLAVSATVTFQGREAMVIKKRILPERFPGVDVVYGDTDSVMLTFDDVTDMAAAGRRGPEVAAFVTEHFAALGYPQMVLEFEKAYLPYLLEGKKRYAGLKHEPDDAGGMVCKGVDCKGIETERRDTMPFTKEVMRGCLDLLLQRCDERAALAFFQERMRGFVDGKVPFDQFVMRKNLSAKVAGKTGTIAHARVNALRAAREPGSEAAAGEQVEYVIVKGHKRDKTTQLAEDAAFARQNGLKLNLLWYFEHTIEEPVRKLFDVFPGLNYKGVCARLRAELDGQRLGIGTSLRDLLTKRKAPPDATGDES